MEITLNLNPDSEIPKKKVTPERILSTYLAKVSKKACGGQVKGIGVVK